MTRAAFGPQGSALKNLVRASPTWVYVIGGAGIQKGNSDLYFAFRKREGIVPVSANFAKLSINSLKVETEEEPQ